MIRSASFNVEIHGIRADSHADIERLAAWIRTGARAGLLGSLRSLGFDPEHGGVSVDMRDFNGQTIDDVREITRRIDVMRENLIAYERVPNANSRERIIDDVCAQVADAAILELADELAAAVPELGRRGALRVLAACGQKLRE